MFKKSLKNKITFSIVLTLLLTCLGFAIFIFFIIRNNLYQLENSSILKSASDEAQKIEQVFASSMETAKTISIQSEIINFLENPLTIDPRPIEKLFNQYNINNQYSVIYLLDKDGNTLVSTDHLLLGFNFSFRDYFKNAINGLSIVDFNVGSRTRESGFYFSSPVLSVDGSISGIVVMKLKPEIVSGKFRLEEGGSHDHFTVVDSYGIVIGTNDHDINLYSSFGTLDPSILQDVVIKNRYGTNSIPSLGLNEIQQKISSYSSPSVFQWYNKKERINQLVSISQIGSQPFYIVYDSDTSVIDAIVQQNAIILILTALVVSGITFVTLNWSVSVFLYPLSQLKKFATNISLGDFNQTISIKTGDEIQDLADVLNRMASGLKNTYREMEDRIQAKTTDLSGKIDELEFSKKAIINLLEDVEKEKEISQKNADDLQKFKLAVGSTSDQIIITDSDGTILYANQAAEKITGYSLEEIIGNTPRLWGMQMNEDFYKNLWSEIKTNKQSYFGEITNRHKNNTQYIAEIQIHPILNKDEEVIFFVSIERDITKAKEIETMKNDFISVASHQLRTPLGSMRWNLEMLLAGDKGKLPKLAQETIQEIYDSDSRMITLVNDLLNVSRIDQGRIENIPVSTNIIPIIEDSIKEMDYMASKKKVKINLDKKDLSSVTALVDPKRFREVVQNVLSNAVKYNRPSGSIKIEITQNSNETNITISDTGMGISKKDQERIFTKFFRASNAVLSETEGSGLGLFVVKSFVESWGGTVSFTSEENVGTTIYIKLPVNKTKNA